MSDGELAYSSFNKALRIKVLNRCKIGEVWNGNIHPSTKTCKTLRMAINELRKRG